MWLNVPSHTILVPPLRHPDGSTRVQFVIGRGDGGRRTTVRSAPTGVTQTVEGYNERTTVFYRPDRCLDLGLNSSFSFLEVETVDVWGLSLDAFDRRP